MVGLMLLPGYDLNKAAQVVAFFALKEGGAINVLKLSKLVYLAERECMRAYDEPMFYDKLVSMPDGPVASVTLNFMNGANIDDRWSAFVAPRTGYDIPLARDLTLSDLDHLSPADIDILEGLWARFGAYDQYQIRDWTHRPENIPEWSDPEGSSNPISHSTVFEKLGKDAPQELESDVAEFRRLSRVLNAAA
jgi:uncharacterized phage-associated protein